MVEHAAHLLPAQGPIRVFVHHNTLHAFENLPVEEAVVNAGERFGCRPFLEDEDYRREWLNGRILTQDLRAVLSEDLGDSSNISIAGTITRLELRLAILAVGLREPDEKELDWHLNESDKPMDRPLWEACLEAVTPLGPVPQPTPKTFRYRERLLRLTGEDTDALLQPLLIRFCAAFCDQGIAYWRLPSRSLGFLGSFLQTYRHAPLPDAWLKGFDERLKGRYNATQSIARSLQNLEIPPEEWEAYIEEMMLAMRGWPGILRQIEERPDRVLIPSPPGSLLEFAAVRLLLEEQAMGYVTARAHLTLTDLRKTPPRESFKTVSMRAYSLYQAAQILGWPAETVRTSPTQTLLEEVESFGSLNQRRLFHLAYERRYRIKTLDALLCHSIEKTSKTQFQAICCMDEREESYRRHLEETEPACETFGTAGFFGLAMRYRGVEDAFSVPLCPILVEPTHSVREVPIEDTPTSLRQAWGRTAYAFHVGSRTGVRGALFSGLFGTLAALPLVMRIFFPRHAAKLRSSLGRKSLPTRLKWNYTTEESAKVVGNLLEETGLKSCLSRLVVIVGHGSSSLNNPHESAHDCGACGGGRGGPNARVFALMANDPGVRQILGIHPDTIFVAAYHNTCDDLMEYYDLDRVPSSHAAELQRAKIALSRAAALGAQERSRRFDNVATDVTPPEALTAMADRTEDLAQVRPEYGHATNAVAVVGRRSLTRGLFMDRRSFLISYDPDTDPDGAYLIRVLRASAPVGAGINLEYYFSFTDRAGYGCGTKLPHNITGMLGVMDGHASDLRTGLPWQMVEIHEPVRLLVVVESPLDRLKKVLSSLPTVERLVKNRWIQLAVREPGKNEILLYHKGRFEPYQPESRELPQVASSADWYRGHREHLDYARIAPPPTSTVKSESGAA
jgi:uncharacterized protein YbcC (UPF0753/DUF2309 family)